MLRRNLFKLAAGAAVLASPQIGNAQRVNTLIFVPINGLVALDPVWSGGRFTHTHGYMVFDTLYGLDEHFSVHPQMVEGHSLDNNRLLWRLRLRDGLRFHDG